KEKGLRKRGGGTERWPRAEIGSPVVAPPGNRHAHGIDAVTERAGGIEPKISRRKPELTPALVAVDDGSGNEPRIAQELRRIVEPTFGQRGPDRPRGYRAAAIQQRRNDIDHKAVPRPLGLQEFRRASAVRAKMKVEADRRPANTEAVDKHALDELFGAQLRQLGIECQHDRAVELSCGEQAQFGNFGGEPKQRFLGIKERTRMRFEGERG